MAEDIQNLTLQVLRQIRDEVTKTNERIDRVDRTLNDHLGAVETRLDTTNERLGHVEATLAELATQQTFVSKFVRNLAARDRDLAEDVDELRTRVDALERRVP